VRVEQVAYESLDGEVVRMFVLRHADAPPGPRPTILYGYGGFGISLTPGFSAGALAWLEAAALRGGEPARRQRGGRGVAPGRHARAQAAGPSTTCTRRRSAWSTTASPGRTCWRSTGGSNGGLLVVPP
jgi:prolyl oligopeptidase